MLIGFLFKTRSKCPVLNFKCFSGWIKTLLQKSVCIYCQEETYSLLLTYMITNILEYQPFNHEVAQTSKHQLFVLFSNVSLIAFTGTVKSVSIISVVACTVVTALCIQTKCVGIAGINVCVTLVHIWLHTNILAYTNLNCVFSLTEEFRWQYIVININDNSDNKLLISGSKWTSFK